MDYNSSWAEPQAAPPPVHHHLYYAPPPPLHHPDVIQHHQQPRPSSTAAYCYPNPNPNHYPAPTHDAPLPSAAGAGALRPPAVDPYAPRPHANHGGYDGLHAVPYSYPAPVPPAAAAGVAAPSAYYYGGGGEERHSLAVKEAVRQYGVDPHGYGLVLARSLNGLEPAAPPQIRPLHLHGSASHLTLKKAKKKGRKKATKVVQSAYCEESITANPTKAPEATVERKEIPGAEKSRAVGQKHTAMVKKLQEQQVAAPSDIMSSSSNNGDATDVKFLRSGSTYTEDQLNLRDVEANFMGEHVHSLELKLAEVNKLHERDEELKKSTLHIETLDTVILDSQCEIESLKLDLTALEQRCLEAERFCQQTAQEKDMMKSQLEELQFRLQESQQKWLEHCNKIASSDEHVKDEIEKMTNQICKSELLVKQLKEELREEKQKAKEEAEDLTQEMAELRYQIMGMLEEECKRRACIEQASIQRIKDLEAQVQKEQKKSIAALRRFQEVCEQAERRSLEVRKLKNALEIKAPVDAEATENTSSTASIEWFPDKASRSEDGQDKECEQG
ncbi:putative hyaluronan mediated motility receptor [Cocos nucifera]|uniref:Putative hyaluronan mediated motility receptor n=1 Tax=Cocos nucifera TaxID=13894 RepID=A0A8K0N199_COCNU|nr:putative hyaluronan mediated motility receptor [Cocos nucifera]